MNNDILSNIKLNCSNVSVITFCNKNDMKNLKDFYDKHAENYNYTFFRPKKTYDDFLYKSYYSIKNSENWPPDLYFKFRKHFFILSLSKLLDDKEYIFISYYYIKYYSSETYKIIMNEICNKKYINYFLAYEYKTTYISNVYFCEDQIISLI